MKILAVALAYLLGLTALLLMWTDQMLLKHHHHNFVADGNNGETFFSGYYGGGGGPNELLAMLRRHRPQQQQQTAGGDKNNATLNGDGPRTGAAAASDFENKTNEDIFLASRRLREEQKEAARKMKEEFKTKKRAPYYDVYEESATSPYAYAFLVGGIMPEYPKYRDYLNGIFVNAHALRKFGSTADMYLLVEFHYESPVKKLADHEYEMLRQLRVTVLEIPSMPNPTFYQLQFQKFRILAFTKHKRVLYLDSDCCPLQNLDYLFEYSAEKGVLEENVILEGPNDAANGGFFMLKPGEGDLEEINALIRHKEQRMADGEIFDQVLGWGHVLHSRDRRWKGYNIGGPGWSFFAASGDQGLLYYWVLFIKRRVSILLVRGDVQNYVPSSIEGEVEPKEIIEMPFGTNINPVKLRRCGWKFCRYGGAQNTFRHHMGFVKPWTIDWPDDLEGNELKNAQYFWQYNLKEAYDELGFPGALNVTAMGKLKFIKEKFAYVIMQKKALGPVTNLLDY